MVKEIPLTQGKVALVDDDDYDAQGYVRRDFDLALQATQQPLLRDVQAGNLTALPQTPVAAIRDAS